jgi:hypothetical protein
MHEMLLCGTQRWEAVLEKRDTFLSYTDRLNVEPDKFIFASVNLVQDLEFLIMLSG